MSSFYLTEWGNGSVYYISPEGNDIWSGKFNKPNFRKTDGPFRTLHGARDAIRENRRKTNQSDPAIIYLRQGIYHLDEMIQLGPGDSYQTWMNYPGEKVILSGGREITGLNYEKLNGKRVIVATLPEVKNRKWYFKELYLNGERRDRTRLPKSGFYTIQSVPGLKEENSWTEGQDSFEFQSGDIQNWQNMTDIEIIAFHYWIESRMPIKSVDMDKNIIYLGKKSVFRLTEDQRSIPYARYIIENIFEELDRPGEFYLDRNSGKLYYLPKKMEKIKNIRLIAPCLNRILEIKGNRNQKTESILFQGIQFSHSQYDYPPDYPGSGQAAESVPGAVYLENAINCGFNECEFTGLGTYGIEIGPGSDSNILTYCKISDLAAGGIIIRTGSRNTLVSDSEISDGGKLFHSGVGILIQDSPDNRILHNHIHDFDYTGISVGWVWGYGESKGINNKIEFNQIHDIGRGLLNDLGGIYTLGISPGTVIRNNLIYDCYSHGYGGWGIYTDEGSSDILIENNIVYNTRTGNFHQHYGKNNMIRNNIFVNSEKWQIQRTRPEEHNSFDFIRNIIYYKEGQLMEGNWKGGYYFDYNLYYSAGTGPVKFQELSFKEWQDKGQDMHGLIADPLFIDPVNNDFRLKPDSPAFQLGFEPIDLSRIGLSKGK